jgi:hypothetical protein
MGGPALGFAETKEVKQLQKATDVLDEIMGTPDKGILQDLLAKAVCVLASCRQRSEAHL